MRHKTAMHFPPPFVLIAIRTPEGITRDLLRDLKIVEVTHKNERGELYTIQTIVQKGAMVNDKTGTNVLGCCFFRFAVWNFAI